MATPQNRVMQTYRVDLLDEHGAPVKTADVNLSFNVDSNLNPLDSQDRPLGPVVVAVEVQRRLRKLAWAKRIAVTSRDLDTHDWSAPRVVRQRFITVQVDEAGRVVKAAGR